MPVAEAKIKPRLKTRYEQEIAPRLRERFGVDVQAMHADDGIVLRLPDLEVEDVPGGSLDVADLVLMEPETVEDLVTREIARITGRDL